jgi:hypothetical protein
MRKQRNLGPLALLSAPIFIVSRRRPLRLERFLLKITYINGDDFTRARPVVFVQKPDYHLVEDWRWALIVRYHPAGSNHEV